MRFTWKGAVGLAAVLCAGLASLAYGDVIQHGNARVSFKGELRPLTLPRDGTVPVKVSVGATISGVEESRLHSCGESRSRSTATDI